MSEQSERKCKLLVFICSVLFVFVMVYLVFFLIIVSIYVLFICVSKASIKTNYLNSFSFRFRILYENKFLVDISLLISITIVCLY